tara:strand:- start:805 stop:2145 length:1341 start_codon:yes stop_codon:yes gene_type:complete
VNPGPKSRVDLLSIFERKVLRNNIIKTKGDLIAALDIGSTKTCCFIARLDEPRRDSSGSRLSEIRVLGIGHKAAEGVRSGAIVDMEASEVSIRRAVQAAETMAKETIDSVFVNLSGGNPVSQSFAVEVAINGHQIVDADLRTILEQGKSAEIGDGRELIHLLPVDFAIDGHRGIKDPRGMAGQILSAKMHMVTAFSGPIQNSSVVVERCHLNTENYVVSPYASGLACLVEDEMDLGATIIDMGGGTTTIAIFFDGNVVYTDSIPIGGKHVTNDIARGLSTSIMEAERIKTLHGSAILSPIDDRETIEIPQIGEEVDAQANLIRKSKVIEIIQPRIEELLELVKSSISDSGFEGVAGHRVVLTGGASQLPGIVEMVQQRLRKQVRLGRPIRANGLADGVAGPAFSTCVGLLSYAVKNGLDGAMVRPFDNNEPNGILGRVGSWIKENF